jgi:hypothetical protein
MLEYVIEGHNVECLTGYQSFREWAFAHFEPVRSSDVRSGKLGLQTDSPKSALGRSLKEQSCGAPYIEEGKLSRWHDVADDIEQFLEVASSQGVKALHSSSRAGRQRG